VYLGVRCLDLEMPAIDLFLRPAREETYHLHVSGDRADGVVPLVDPDLTYLETTLQLDWAAQLHTPPSPPACRPRSRSSLFRSSLSLLCRLLRRLTPMLEE
jgi:hypothetical protein